MESVLQGRLRNTHLPASKAMIPLYEAVVNSIQAIEEDAERTKQLISSYLITVTVLRENTLLSSEEKRGEDRIDSFLIQDNGSGFTDENWKSFNRLDSLYKEKKGCRGIGRLMWLKAFREVEVDSLFTVNDRLMRRRFSFHPVRDVEPLGQLEESKGPKITIVRLNGFERRYADHAYKSLRAIAGGILEHCLWYFVRAEGVPAIRIVDGTEHILLEDLFDEHMHTSAKAQHLRIGEHPFEITHVKFRASMNKANSLNYCAAGRLVRGESLQGKIPGLAAVMQDSIGDFTYAAYLTGSYLDDHVLEQRIGFHIDDESIDLLKDTELSFKTIREAVIPHVRDYLSESISQNIAASAERIESYVTRTAPRYRPIIRYINEDELVVDPEISDRELDLALHRQLYKVEERILSEGHQIMVPLKGETEEAYQQRLEQYLQMVADLKQSDLANYVMHRRTVFDLLEAAICSDEAGKFAREDVIHELIVPMRCTSDDYEFRRENLWLIDERLAFHDFLASDKPLSAIEFTSDNSGKEPDLASLRVYNNPLLVSERGVPTASLTVVEIKKPMRKGYQAGVGEKSDPILQSLQYLSRLRRGATARGGRPIPNADRIPGFIYVLADLTLDMEQCCRLHQLTRAADGMAYFGYHRDEAYNAYIQVISFDGLVASAKERNRAFFDKLGLPSR
jgi:hypothetical protein